MNEVCERALECYIKKLENDKIILIDFAKQVKSIVFDYDGDKSDERRAKEVRALVRTYDSIFKED